MPRQIHRITFLALLIIASLCLFTSCNKILGYSDSYEDLFPESKRNDAPNAAQEPALAKKSLSHSAMVVSKEYYDKEGPVYINVNFELPKFEGDYAGIPGINAYYTQMAETFFDANPCNLTMKEVERKTSDKIPEDVDSENPVCIYYRNSNYTVTVLSDIISVLVFFDGHAGGTGWGETKGGTFDLNTGKKLELSDVLVKTIDYPNDIFEILTKAIAPNAQEYMLIADEGLGIIKTAYDLNDFALTTNALLLFFQKYAIADGATGMPQFEFSYESLKDVLAIDVSHAQTL
ncbi:MAG: RsiV family protein [Proteobacteria bacterium]|nr:RsiV family protein [Pseudomonadota bacterium]